MARWRAPGREKKSIYYIVGCYPFVSTVGLVINLRLFLRSRLWSFCHDRFSFSFKKHFFITPPKTFKPFCGKTRKRVYVEIKNNNNAHNDNGRDVVYPYTLRPGPFSARPFSVRRRSYSSLKTYARPGCFHDAFLRGGWRSFSTDYDEKRRVVLQLLAFPLLSRTEKRYGFLESRRRRLKWRVVQFAQTVCHRCCRRHAVLICNARRVFFKRCVLRSSGAPTVARTRVDKKTEVKGYLCVIIFSLFQPLKRKFSTWIIRFFFFYIFHQIVWKYDV